jgi:hypothetical protein
MFVLHFPNMECDAIPSTRSGARKEPEPSLSINVKPCSVSDNTLGSWSYRCITLDVRYRLEAEQYPLEVSECREYRPAQFNDTGVAFARAQYPSTRAVRSRLDFRGAGENTTTLAKQLHAAPAD